MYLGLLLLLAKLLAKLEGFFHIRAFFKAVPILLLPLSLNQPLPADWDLSGTESTQELCELIKHLLQEVFGLSSSPGLLGRRAGWDMILPVV